jgi:hypothetical protein
LKDFVEKNQFSRAEVVFQVDAMIKMSMMMGEEASDPVSFCRRCSEGIMDFF